MGRSWPETEWSVDIMQVLFGGGMAAFGAENSIERTSGQDFRSKLPGIKWIQGNGDCFGHTGILTLDAHQQNVSSKRVQVVAEFRYRWG